MSEPEAPGAGAGTAAAAGERPVHLRMSRLHLRMGSLELARAELEASAGGGELDTDALLDLAEVRWRTGDISGAGVAANTYLAADRDDVLALVIAAEASAAAGHPGEARQLVSRVLGHEETDLDAVFAGMPRSWMWPLEPTEEPASVSELFPGAERPMAGPLRPEPDGHARPASHRPPPPAPTGVDRPGAEGAGSAASVGAESAGPVDAGAEAPADVQAEPGLPAAAAPASIAAQVAGPGVPAGRPTPELEAARTALEAGDATAAAERLAGLLRQRPELAASVLGALSAAAGPAADAVDRPLEDAVDRPLEDAPPDG